MKKLLRNFPSNSELLFYGVYSGVDETSYCSHGCSVIKIVEFAHCEEGLIHKYNKHEIFRYCINEVQCLSPLY